jgi:hypothetical protein
MKLRSSNEEKRPIRAAFGRQLCAFLRRGGGLGKQPDVVRRLGGFARRIEDRAVIVPQAKPERVPPLLVMPPLVGERLIQPNPADQMSPVSPVSVMVTLPPLASQFT